MTRPIILLLVLMLAACGSDDRVVATNASVAEVAAKVQAAKLDEDRFRAGKWAISGRIDDIQMPGMPASVAAQIKRQGTMMDGVTSCVTEADAKKPAADFFTGNKSCRYDHFAMGQGKIDARMRCGSGEMVQLTTLTGTYGPEIYRMAMTTAMENPSRGTAHGMEGMTMKLSVEGKRIGACDAAARSTNKEAAP